MLCERNIRFSAVEIVGVDNGKIIIAKLVLAAKQSVTRTPRFYTSFRYAVDKTIKRLESIIDLYLTVKPASDILFEKIIMLRANEQQHTVKSRKLRVKDRKIEDDLTVWSDRFKLLRAAEPASETRGKNNKRHLFYISGISMVTS